VKKNKQHHLWECRKGKKRQQENNKTASVCEPVYGGGKPYNEQVRRKLKFESSYNGKKQERTRSEKTEGKKKRKTTTGKRGRRCGATIEGEGYPGKSVRRLYEKRQRVGVKNYLFRGIGGVWGITKTVNRKGRGGKSAFAREEWSYQDR